MALAELARERPSESAEAAVVTKALVRAAANLKLPSRVLGTIVGLSETSISRMKHGSYQLARSSKEFELAVLFIRMYRSLLAIVGGDDAIARAWLENPNTALAGRPLDFITSISGLMHVIAYLDARRAVV